MALLNIKISYALIRWVQICLIGLGTLLRILGLTFFILLANDPIDTAGLPPDQIKLNIQMSYFTVAGAVIESLNILLQPLIFFPTRQPHLRNAISTLLIGASLSCAIGFSISSKRFNHTITTRYTSLRDTDSGSMVLGAVATSSVVNYIPVIIFTFGSSRWAMPSPFEPVMAIRKAPQATQYELNDLASDNGRLARAYRAGHHPPSRTTVVSTQPLLAQTNSSRSRPRPRGQLAPQARLGNQPIPASTPSFSPQFRHWTPQRASDTAAGLSLLAGGSIIDMCFLIAYPIHFRANSYLRTSAFSLQIASLLGKLLLLTCIPLVIRRRTDLKTRILNLLTRWRLLIFIWWSLIALWIAGVICPATFRSSSGRVIHIVYGSLSGSCLVASIVILLGRSMRN